MATLLCGLRSLPHEVEWVEFEHNDSAPGEIGEHLSALSNAAGLHGEKAALIVWGVEGSTHRVIGATFRTPRRKTGDEDLEPWLARHLHPAVYFTIRQLLFGSTAVVIFKIQPCQHPPGHIIGYEHPFVHAMADF